PGNILIDTSTGRAHVSDFGLSQAVGNPELTAPGELLGAPRYMSPEQVEGQHVDHRSDLFSLGVVLYRMLTGSHAFAGRKPITLARQICDSTPTPVRRLRTDAPEWLCQLTKQLLAKHGNKRPQSASDVVATASAALLGHVARSFCIVMCIVMCVDFWNARYHQSRTRWAPAVYFSALKSRKRLIFVRREE
ncbi:MAG: protein kinase, partial [Fuerstiella sp.]